MAWRPIKPRYVCLGKVGVRINDQYAYVTKGAFDVMRRDYPDATHVCCFFEDETRQVAFVLTKGGKPNAEVLTFPLNGTKVKYSKNLRYAMLEIGFTEGFYPMHKFDGELAGMRVHYLINSPKGAKETVK